MSKAKPDGRKPRQDLTRSHMSLLSPAQVRLLKRCGKDKWAEGAIPDQKALQDLISRGCLTRLNGELIITPEGKQALRRAQLAKEEDGIFAAQHQDRQPVTMEAEGQPEAGRQSTVKASQPQLQSQSQPQLMPMPWLNRKESPLAALASRKRPDGSPMLSACQLEAGERFRSDFERGQMAPMMGINWDRLGEAGGAAKGQGPTGRHDISDSAMGARQRFSKAAFYVGDELSGILIDFCCFLKGLEAIERERQWPARSAKQILSLALDRLARHYGLAEKVEGPLRNLMRHWGTEDYRPQM